MGLIREPLNMDLVIDSNANAQDLEKIDLMIQELKSESVVKYDSLDNALKSKNESARRYLKTAKLP
jgi:spermidine/putrescine-binding protein